MKRTLKIAAAVLTAVLLLTTVLPAGVFAEAADEYEEKTEKYDFDGDEGSMLEDTGLADTFIMTIIRAAGGDAVIKDDGTALMQSYAAFCLDPDFAYDCMNGAYTFSLDYGFKGDNPALGGIFIRSIDPSYYAVTNPKNSNVQQAFYMYEWDWYKENNGKEKGISSVGGSGIRVFVNNSSGKIGVSVKTRVEDGLYVYSNGVELTPPDGFDAKGLNNFRFVDDGKSRLEIYVCGTLLSTVEYGGEPGTWPDGDEGDCDALYFKQAAIKDAEGNVLLELNNARISAQYSIIGIGNRGDVSTTLDNVELTWLQKKKAATPVPTEVPATEKPVETPKATQNSGSNATAAPVQTLKPNDNKTNNGGSKYAWIYVACGVVAAGALAAIVISSVKGKKKTKK